MIDQSFYIVPVSLSLCLLFFCFLCPISSFLFPTDVKCDQMAKLFAQYLAIYSKTNWLKSIQILPK